MEKALSQAQRDQLLMNTAKEDVFMKREMLKSFDKSNKIMEESIGKMTACLTSLGEGIATGMRMLANAIADTPSCTSSLPITVLITTIWEVLRIKKL